MQKFVIFVKKINICKIKNIVKLEIIVTLPIAYVMNFTIIKKLTHAKTFDKGQFHTCLTRAINVCCKQIILTSYFQSAIT